MATDWTSPKTSDTHTNELAATRGRDESNARMDYTGDTNIPDGTIRWNKAGNRFEIWSAASSAWSELSSKYLINVDQVDGYDAGNASGNVPVSNGNVNSNLNADKLDGQHGTFFQARANHTGTQAPSTISPQGAGSGLNADMLDGYHSSYFETPDGAQAKAYGVFTSPTYGTVDWNTLDNPGANILNMGNAANGPGPSSYFHCMVINYSGNITQLAIPYGNSMAPGMYMRGRYAGVWTAWEKVWTSSNDGTGSGLDADLLDGQDSTAFTTKAILTTKGDLYVRDATGVTRQPIGSDGQVLTADSAQATGVKWATVSSTPSSWSVFPIGVPIAVWDHLSSSIVPPNSGDVVYVKLTAGQSASGGYNYGNLSSESVTGSAPLVVATAVISLSTSPLYNTTIHLINTEEAVIRARTTSGTQQNDAFQGHRHFDTTSGIIRASNSTEATRDVASSANGATLIFQNDGTTAGAYGTPRLASETRPKNVSATFYLRIK